MSKTTTAEVTQPGRVEVRLGGFGGQGIILAGSILGRAAAVHAGRNAVLAQSYGPESRGGACMAEIVIADGEIAYPRVVSPDVLVFMSQQAYDKYAPGRPKSSILIVDDDLVDLGDEPPPDVLRARATRLAEELGRRVVANIVMLGFLVGATGVVNIETLREAVAASVPPGTEKLNLVAVDAGYEQARALVGGEEP
ncbi:MAG: 2-oxoacid:acceptor oxidoreductase family protein [Acidimicrobiales bacterium]